MAEAPVIGSNASSGGGGAPSGAAGGELAGTYPNPTVKDAVIDDANIVAGGLTNAAISSSAAIAASKLAAIPESGVTNLTSDLAAKAPLASPALTGTPTVPTAAQGTNTTQAASTAMVQSEVTLLAPKASPTFTGTVTLPSGLVLPASVSIPTTATAVTQTANDDSTKPATTAYVDRAAGSQLKDFWPTNAIACTTPRRGPQSTTRTPTSGNLYMSLIYIDSGVVVSNFNAYNAGAVQTNGTHTWFALFNNSRVQLAATADNTAAAAWAGTSVYTQAVATIASGASATFTTTYSGLYYVGLTIVGAATLPTPAVTTIGTAFSAIAPIIAGNSNTAQTTPNAFAFTATAVTAANSLDLIWLT